MLICIFISQYIIKHYIYVHIHLDKKLLKTQRQELKDNREEIRRLGEILTEDRLKGYNK
jgi:hypothetical protein